MKKVIIGSSESMSKSKKNTIDPEDIINKIGEPYIKSKSKEISSNAGLGLGTFLGKTLLERQGANLQFKRNSKLGGALVVISWSPNSFTNV